MPDTQRQDKAQIIAALRDEMQSRGLDALIVPRFDAHQGEYVAPHDQRLKFVTGFSGSAGMAIVTPDTVAVFVDGRYTVQIANECSGALFSHFHLFDEAPDVWLGNVAQQGWRIGFDPMHLPPSWYDRFNKGCVASQAELVPQPANPVDVIWHDQPASPKRTISPFSMQFAGKSSADKNAALQARLKEEGAQFHVETQPDNIAWFLNVRGDDVNFNPMPHSFMLVSETGDVTWCVDDSKFEAGLQESLPDHVSVVGHELFLATLKSEVGADDTVLIDPDFSPVAARLVLEVQGAKVRAMGSILTLMKAEKNPTELDGMRACHIQDGIAVTKFSAWLAREVPARSAAGMPVSEREAEEKVLEFRKEQHGFISESFNTISAAAGNAAMCHYSATDAQNAQVLSENPYLLDSGGQYENGTTDITRSFAFGSLPEGYAEAYTAVFKAFHSLATLRFPKGTQGHHIDAICRRPLWDLGLDYDHGTGHGVGHCLSVHEQPQRIGKAYNPVDLRPGMVMSIEPGYYEADRFGIRIENLFEIIEAEDGFLEFRNITFVPIQTDMVNVDSLTDQERDWLQAYNLEVCEKVSPFLSSADQKWLEGACASI